MDFKINEKMYYIDSTDSMKSFIEFESPHTHKTGDKFSFEAENRNYTVEITGLGKIYSNFKGEFQRAYVSVKFKRKAA